ncbi:MAG: ATP-dependent Clp endopeptidase proteolytic subunit ClpP [Candidatus Cloacimonadota bacterium]|nr:MAG: ATP-dependent Clp endopeptidase proteolytic subunit ClpP [Candidatus Cloacimonadota bacterium]
MPLIPMVIEQSGRTERAFDIYSRLLKDRIVFIGSIIDDEVANLVIAQLLYLEAEDKEREISVYINSGGGIISSGLAIYDTIQYIKPDVTTICMGMAASMAAILLSAGTKSKRFALPHSRMLIHQPMGGIQGQAIDIEIHAKEIMKMKKELNEILAKHTGQPISKIEKDSDRNFWMSAEEAKNYGIVDTVIKTKEEIKKEEKNRG